MMTRFSHGLACGLAISALAGCGAPAPPTPATAAKAIAPFDQLNKIVDRYWDEHLPLENAISPQFLADALNIERRYLAEVMLVPREGLDANSKLTYDIFRRQRETVIEGFTFPAELLPMNPFDGEPLRLAELAAELGKPPFDKAADYENWLRQIDGYVHWTQQATVNMREGIRRGYTPPRALIERVLPIIDRLSLENGANPLYRIIQSLPAGINEPERGHLLKDLSSATTEKLLPANRALRDFLQREYLPRARDSLALAGMPLGVQWYAYRVRRSTDSSLSPAEIHRLGLAEVERIAAHIEPPRDVPAAAAAPAAEDLVNAYQDLALRIRGALPTLFSEDPSAAFSIGKAEWLRTPGAPLFYRRLGPGGLPPAVLYIEPAVRTVSIPSFLQEALPGRHFQITLQQDRAEIPKFRRFGAAPAFIEGWGLYSASLGDELGLPSDDTAKSDAASLEMRCAVALVVDTGLHSQGWTRTSALDYLRKHLTIAELDAQSLVDWYAANPAGGLSCMMGGLKVRAIRARAQQVLGGRFEIRAFHSEMLKDGAMPMDILEAKMKAWMERAP
jgi:uncharacterized protein (DUF885 family)